MDHTHSTASSEVAVHHERDSNVRRIIKTTIILSVITFIELGLGLTLYAADFSIGVRIFIKGVIVILSLAKAFYIVSIFMHLGDELRNLIMTIIVPLMLFIWFIGAFLWDGNSYKNLRNTYDRYHKEQSTKKTEKKEHQAQKPGQLE